MPVKKKVTSKRVAAKTVVKKTLSRTSGLSVPVYSLTGRTSGTLALPKEIFGQKVNEKLLAQAVRVYMTNQKVHTASTKTRGEVEGSTAKIYRQKGTGRARHGSIRAPIFVGGGIVFGPKPRIVKLGLSKKMRKAALVSALSSKALDKNIIGLSNLEKASGKTKEIVQLLTQLNSKFNPSTSPGARTQNSKISSVLIVTGEKMDNAVRATRNIPSITTLPASLINAYEVLKHELLLLTKDAVEKLSRKEEKK